MTKIRTPGTDPCQNWDVWSPYASSMLSLCNPTRDFIIFVTKTAFWCSKFMTQCAPKYFMWPQLQSTRLPPSCSIKLKSRGWTHHTDMLLFRPFVWTLLHSCPCTSPECYVTLPANLSCISFLKPRKGGTFSTMFFECFWEK